MRYRQFFWLWPTFVLVAVVALILCVFVFPDTPLRGPVVLLFVALCPGIALVPLIQLGDLFIELTISIAVSISLSGIIVIIFLYAHDWSLATMLWVLVGLSIAGSIAQLIIGLTFNLKQLRRRARERLERKRAMMREASLEDAPSDRFIMPAPAQPSSGTH